LSKDRIKKVKTKVSPVSLPLDASDVFQPPKWIIVALAGVLGINGWTITIGIPITVALSKGVNPTVLGIAILLSGSLFIVGLLLPYRVRNSRVLGGFVSVYKFHKMMRRIFWIAIAFNFTILLVVGFFVQIQSWVASFLYILLFGLFPYATRAFSSYWNEGRLSIRQFLLEKMSQIPDYSWLRIGLGRVEERLLATKGLAVPGNRLFYASSYAIFKGLPMDSTLESLAEWLNKPEGSDIHSLVEDLLKTSKECPRGAVFRVGPFVACSRVRKGFLA